MKQFVENEVDEKTQTVGFNLPLKGPVDIPSVGADQDDVPLVVGVLDRRTENWWLLAAFWAMFLCGEPYLVWTFSSEI